jgi:DNA-binding transcriptional ArsR family regulator/uncharacterized protein YndB with AHSA1/START domain
MIRLVRSAADLASPDIWQTLADPTRRALIDRLAAGPLTTSALCESSPLSRFAIMKHLGVLEASGLVTSRKSGRVRTNHLNAARLVAQLDRWLSPRAKHLARGALTFAASFEPQENPMAEPTAVVEVALDWTINAPVTRVWEALFNSPQDWWPTAHRVLGGDAKMEFAPELGASLRETGANGSGVEWYRIYAIDQLRSIDLRGELAARYGGPALSLLHIALEPDSAGSQTTLRLTDSLIGKVSDEFKAATAEGWQDIIGNGLCAAIARTAGAH